MEHLSEKFVHCCDSVMLDYGAGGIASTLLRVLAAKSERRRRETGYVMQLKQIQSLCYLCSTTIAYNI